MGSAYASMVTMTDSSQKSLLLISGSTREGSINTAVLKTSATLLPWGWGATLHSELTQLPHFNPDLEQSGPPSIVADLRRSIRESEAVLFCTPEYAGAMPGALKNLLEWTIGDTVLSDKPVGWINPSIAPRRAAGTYETLRIVLSYTGAAIIDDACLDIPIARSQVGETGTIEDSAIQKQLHTAVTILTSVQP